MSEFPYKLYLPSLLLSLQRVNSFILMKRVKLCAFSSLNRMTPELSVKPISKTLGKKKLSSHEIEAFLEQPKPIFGRLLIFVILYFCQEERTCP